MLKEAIPDRSNFNLVRRKLQPFINKLSEQISDKLSETEHTFIIDSIPICRFARCNKLKIIREDSDFLPIKGYSAIEKLTITDIN